MGKILYSTCLAWINLLMYTKWFLTWKLLGINISSSISGVFSAQLLNQKKKNPNKQIKNLDKRLQFSVIGSS